MRAVLPGLLAALDAAYRGRWDDLTRVTSQLSELI